MAFDISRLRRGEKVAAVAAVLLFILMFFDWYTVSVSGGLLGGLSIEGSAWEAFGFIDIYLFIVIVAAIALAVLTATERTPALPVTMAVIVTALAALGTLLVLYRLIDTPVGDVPDGVDVSRTIWAFLGLVAVAAITYGGYLSMRDEGTSVGDVKAQASAAFDGASTRRDEGGAASAPPPPPPPPAASEPPAVAPPSEPPAGASYGSESPPSSTA
jgi:cation transport ATPase